MATASLPERSPLILCAGIAVIDYIFRIEAMPKPDTKNRASAFTIASGGNMANAAVSIVRLGARARLSAPLGGPAGTELSGDAILRKLEQRKYRPFRGGAHRRDAALRFRRS